jgi:hypothetical protein
MQPPPALAANANSISSQGPVSHSLPVKFNFGVALRNAPDTLTETQQSLTTAVWKPMKFAGWDADNPAPRGGRNRLWDSPTAGARSRVMQLRRAGSTLDGWSSWGGDAGCMCPVHTATLMQCEYSWLAIATNAAIEVGASARDYAARACNVIFLFFHSCFSTIF